MVTHSRIFAAIPSNRLPSAPRSRYPFLEHRRSGVHSRARPPAAEPVHAPAPRQAAAHARALRAVAAGL